MERLDHFDPNRPGPSQIDWIDRDKHAVRRLLSAFILIALVIGVIDNAARKAESPSVVASILGEAR